MKTKYPIIGLIMAAIIAIPFVFAQTAPDNVTGVNATPVDAVSIALSWDASNDSKGAPVDHYRIYYGATSIQAAGTGDYDSQVDTPDNKTTYVVAGLTANTAYYFALTAVDSDDTESELYSLEASATTPATGEGGEQPAPAPEAGEDITAPTVTSIVVPDKLHIQVKFSEAIKLPALLPEAAFAIAEQIDPTKTLTAKSAVIDPSDATGSTVLIETDAQTKDVNYIVTAGVTITDNTGNPIISGNFDSGLFLGTDKEPAAPAPVAVECAENDDACFYSKLEDCTLAKASLIVSGTDAAEMEITGTETGDKNRCLLKFTSVKSSEASLLGKEMECKVAKGVYQEYRNGNFEMDPKDDLEDTKDFFQECTGNFVAPYKSLHAAVPAAPVADTTPPENITNLVLTFKAELEKFSILLGWTASINSAKDLIDQFLYQSMDRGKNYDAGKSLGSGATSYQINSLEGGKEYTFKITTKDTAGNESVGVVKSIRLPQTGVGLGLLLLGSAAGARFALRRRKKDINQF